MTGAATPPATPNQAPALARAVVAGSVWLALNSLINRVASFVTQLMLAWFLSDNDFGIYAIAVSIALIGTSFREGGVRQVLIQRQAEYESLVGPVFWIATAFNCGAALIIVAAGPAAMAAYGYDDLFSILLLIALSLALSTPGTILMTRLRVELRFRELAMIFVCSSLLRYVGTIVLAWAGYGPLSFVLPLPAVALLEWALATRANPDRLWRRSLELQTWGALLRQTPWVALGSLAAGTFGGGSYFLVGLIVPAGVVGVHFFAYQMVMQLGGVLAFNTEQVLFPAFSRLSAEPERLRQAVLRSVTQVMFVSAPTALALVVLFEPVEQLLFRGRWAEAVLPVQVIAALYPFHILAVSVPYAVLQARGAFRTWALMLVFISVSTIVSSALGARIFGTATSISASLSVSMFLASFVFAAVALRPLGIGVGSLLAATMPAQAAAVVAAAAGVGAVEMVSTRFGPVFQVVAGGAAFVGTIALLSRVLLRRQLVDALEFLPRPARHVVASLLVLP